MQERECYAVDECKGNEGNQKGNWLKGREGKLSICRLMIGGMNYCISGQCNRKERDTVLEEFMGYRVSNCCSGKSEIFFCEIKFVLCRLCALVPLTYHRIAALLPLQLPMHFLWRHRCQTFPPFVATPSRWRWLILEVDEFI